jgi:hypothetical protein
MLGFMDYELTQLEAKLEKTRSGDDGIVALQRKFCSKRREFSESFHPQRIGPLCSKRLRWADLKCPLDAALNDVLILHRRRPVSMSEPIRRWASLLRSKAQSKTTAGHAQGLGRFKEPVAWYHLEPHQIWVRLLLYWACENERYSPFIEVCIVILSSAFVQGAVVVLPARLRSKMLAEC